MNRSEKLNVLGHSWFSTKSVSAELFSRPTVNYPVDGRRSCAEVKLLFALGGFDHLTDSEKTRNAAEKKTDFT